MVERLEERGWEEWVAVIVLAIGGEILVLGLVVLGGGGMGVGMGMGWFAGGGGKEG